MDIFDFEINPLCHEELLTVHLLSQGSCRKSELINRIRNFQGTKVSPFIVHSESNYYYWFRALKKRRIITEESKILSLTNLGRWVAAGNVATLSVRNHFAYLVCDKCSNYIRLVICTPLMNTLISNSKGVPFVDIRCPECGNLSRRHNMGGIGSQGFIAEFYNQALVDLERFITVVGIPI